MFNRNNLNIRSLTIIHVFQASIVNYLHLIQVRHVHGNAVDCIATHRSCFN